MIKKKKFDFLLLLTILITSLAITYKINNYKTDNSIKEEKEIVSKKNQIKPADPFVPNPDAPHNDMSWNFTSGTIIGYRQYSSMGVSDVLYNISELKYFAESDNVTGNNAAYYGVSLTPAFWNVSTGKVEEFTNHTVFPICNVSLINYTLPYDHGFSVLNMAITNDLGPEFWLNLFVPMNISKELDIYWCANATLWMMSMLLKKFPEGAYEPPQSKDELIDFTVTSNSIHYTNPSKGTYCNLYYYNNGTLRTGELLTYFPESPNIPFIINRTRIFDFNPLNELQWSERFNETGDILFYGMDCNETKVEYNNTIDRMLLEIEPPEDEDDGYHAEIIYAQQIYANISYWDYTNEKWVFHNTSIVSSANDINPLELSILGEDETMSLPPFLLIPEHGTYLTLDKTFERFEIYFDDILVESGNYWIKITNTTNSKFSKLSYFSDGILRYMYSQGAFPFEIEDEFDTDLMLFFKNYTTISGLKQKMIPLTFDLEYISISLNVSTNSPATLYHSGFPYNPTNKSISNAIAYFDLLINKSSYLNNINITIQYDSTKYTNIKFYWFNTSANEGRGDWEEIPIKNLRNGVIIMTINHTSIFSLTGDIITAPPLPSSDDNDDDEEEPFAIPLGNYYLIFLVMSIVGIIMYNKRKFLLK